MRRYLEAIQAGDREAAFAHYADDLVLHIPGRSAFAGKSQGKEAFIAYIQAALAQADEAEVELIDMLSSDERVALIVRERLRSGDRVLDMRRANVYRVHDERIVEVWIFESDQYGVDEFLAG